MKLTLKRLLAQLLALALLLGLCLTPASALTPDQLKALLQELYLDEIDDAVLDQNTIEGILEALGDPYTRYMSPEDFEAFVQSMSDEHIGGIGIGASSDAEGYLILTIYEGLAADKAGLRAGDIITAVDGKDTKGVDASTVATWLRGEVGSEVTLTVQRTSGAVKEYTLTRVEIILPSTESERIGSVGYIYCQSFGDTTLGHFKDALAAHEGSNVWVVDLRNNGGGDVKATIDTLGLFLGTGVLAYMRNGNGEYMVWISQEKAKTMQPTIVVTSPWTASAAEIFSGVIRDTENGLIIGEKTYGKGVAQVILTQEEFPEYFAEGDAVAITAYRYYTTGGNTADKIGIIPHILVDAELAADIALLLGAEETAEQDMLRLSLGSWRWYIDLTIATTEVMKPYFTALLEALPPAATLAQRQNEQWSDVTVSQLVEKHGLTEYESRAFTDAGSGKRGEKINTLACYDILKGYGGGEFRPEENMTRAEFCALLVQALGLDTSEGSDSFSDVTAADWHYGAVSAVHRAGLMNGIGGGRFDPEGTVSHEQMIAVMGRVAATLNTFLYEDAKGYAESDYTVPGYSDWAMPWLWLLADSQTSMLGGTLSLLYDQVENIPAEAPATRGATAELLYNIYSYLCILNI